MLFRRVVSTLPISLTWSAVFQAFVGRKFMELICSLAMDAEVAALADDDGDVWR